MKKKTLINHKKLVLNSQDKKGNVGIFKENKI